MWLAVRNTRRESSLTRIGEEAKAGREDEETIPTRVTARVVLEDVRTSRPFHPRRPSLACSGRWINKLTVHTRAFLGRKGDGGSGREGKGQADFRANDERWEFRAHKTTPARWHAGLILASAQFIHNRPFQRITLFVP